MSRVADALGIARLAAAAVLPGALLRGIEAPRPLPVILFAAAATTDFLDGIVARRGTPTPHGAVLDNVADVAFVLAASVTGAALGLVSWTAPVAIALAFGAYAVASLKGSRRIPARTTIGHAAGIANYALAGLIAGTVALPSLVPRTLVAAAGVAVTAVNLGAVGQRFITPRVRAS